MNAHPNQLNSLANASKERVSRIVFVELKSALSQSFIIAVVIISIISIIPFTRGG